MAALASGRGDIAAAGLTATAARRARVDQMIAERDELKRTAQKKLTN